MVAGPTTETSSLITDDALRFARVSMELQILSFEELLDGVARWTREGAREPLRTVLVRHGILSEEQALTVARSTVFRPADESLKKQSYELGEPLGRGANGVVHLATDNNLRREVALKMHSRGAEMSDVELLRFTHEAQVTGQLGHPGIVPVHDLGKLPDVRHYYTMRKIEGEDLKEVFAALKAGDSEAREHWTANRMVRKLLQVAEALAFAHDRGVIHRDVKPANIMIGDWRNRRSYGEVLLLDWGVSRVIGRSEDGRKPVDTWRSVGGEDLTIDGTVAGTPAYMAPEQARGDIDAIGPAADVYSVGVILYEFMCGKRPFRARNIQSLLDMVISDEIVAIGDRDLQYQPRRPDLEALCMRCLEKNPDNRYADGRALAQALEAFLDDDKAYKEAEQLTARGLTELAAYESAADRAREEEAKLRRMEADLPPWAHTEERLAISEQAAEWSRQRSERDDRYDSARSSLKIALEYQPHYQPATEALAKLFERRLLEAEERGKDAHWLRDEIRLHNPALLAEESTELRIRTEPQGARVTLFRLGEQNRILAPELAQPLELTPVDTHALDTGSYTLQLEHEGYTPVTAALHTGARKSSRTIELSLRLPRLDEVADGFKVVPAGNFRRGGDLRSIDGSTPALVSLPSFAIGTHPVTQGEFQRWLHSGIVGDDVAETFDWWAELTDVPERERSSLPALGVPLDLARAYATWLSERLGFQLRLPQDDEWEKAARGADGRTYPWGNRWVATFCNGPDAFADSPRPRPVGSALEDCSVYGVCDLAGGVREWVIGDVPHRPERAWLRGGSWRSHPSQARICSRTSLPRNSRDRTVGFRLVHELDL